MGWLHSAQLTGTKVWHNIVLRAGIAALSEFNPLAVKPFLAPVAQHWREAAAALMNDPEAPLPGVED